MVTSDFRPEVEIMAVVTFNCRLGYGADTRFHRTFLVLNTFKNTRIMLWKPSCCCHFTRRLQCPLLGSLDIRRLQTRCVQAQATGEHEWSHSDRRLN